MNKEELAEIDKSLKHLKNIASILESKRGLYFYYNYPTSSTREVLIHSHKCGFCKWGSGSDKGNVELGKNGVWVGPFENIEKAEKFAFEIINLDKLTPHNCI